MKQISAAALFMGLLTTAQAHAGCLNANSDSRLRTYCVGETLKNRLVNLGDAQVLDVLLKREGYERGVGLPPKLDRTNITPFASPILDYSANINAGNPNRMLVLGELEFTGDEANFRKSGILAGVAIGMNGRHVYGEGRYLDFTVGASYAHSPRHDIGIGRAFASVCSRNHIQDHWYVDGCANTTRLNRELNNETKSNIELSVSKLFSTTTANHHAATVGLRRYFEHNSYKQNQLVLGWQTIRDSSFYSALNVTLGEAVSEKLAMRRSVSATIGSTLFGRAITASVGYSYADGGKLLGFARDDTTYTASLNYAIDPRISVSVGYKHTNSTIDYFREREPIVGIQLAPFRF